MIPANDKRFIKRLAMLFLLFTLVCVAAGFSRLSTSAWNLSRCADVLRVRELLSMFVFAPVISIFFWLFYRCLARDAVNRVMDLLCILAIWFIACGMGIHDPANCLSGVYKAQLQTNPNLGRSIVFIDDQLGHWVFWCGFVLGTWCLGIQQLLKPLAERMSLVWIAVFTVVSLALMGVMLTNLWNEYPKTRADLIVIGVAFGALIPLQMVLARGVSLLRMPVLYVVYTAYAGSVAGTLICWQFRYGIFF